MLSNALILSLVHAIYVTEGSNHTAWTYGIKTHYVHTSPKQACINTVKHYCMDHSIVKIDKQMIEGLAEKYCPVECDPMGYKHWIINMERILHV